MSDLMKCQRCQDLFIALDTINCYDDSGRLSIATRICHGCAKETGLLPARYPEMEEREIFDDEVVPESNLSPAEVEATELN
jgi:hypothetical protein